MGVEEEMGVISLRKTDLSRPKQTTNCFFRHLKSQLKFIDICEPGTSYRQYFSIEL